MVRMIIDNSLKFYQKEIIIVPTFEESYRLFLLKVF